MVPHPPTTQAVSYTHLDGIGAVLGGGEPDEGSDDRAHPEGGADLHDRTEQELGGHGGDGDCLLYTSRCV